MRFALYFLVWLFSLIWFSFVWRCLKSFFILLRDYVTHVELLLYIVVGSEINLFLKSKSSRVSVIWFKCLIHSSVAIMSVSIELKASIDWLLYTQWISSPNQMTNPDIVRDFKSSDVSGWAPFFEILASYRTQLTSSVAANACESIENLAKVRKLDFWTKKINFSVRNTF